MRPERCATRWKGCKTFQIAGQRAGHPPRRMMKRILIVEDHPDTQSLLCDLLELEGYEVRCSGEAQGVLSLARRVQPDLIVLDVKLPGLSGIDLLDLLNHDKQLSAVPVLMCS